MPDVRGYAAAVAHLQTSVTTVQVMHRNLVWAIVGLCAERAGADAKHVAGATQASTPEYEARMLAITMLHVGLSFTIREVAGALGVPRSTVQRQVDMVADQREEDAELDRWLDRTASLFCQSEVA